LTQKNNVKARSQQLKDFQSLAGCSSVACLRSASESSLRQANFNLIVEKSNIIGMGPNFSPVVDGDYVPNAPSILLSRGNYHGNVKTVAANNADEVSTFSLNGLIIQGGYFIPANATDAFFQGLLSITVPGASDSAIREINQLYPPSEPAYNRCVEFQGDIAINCNARFVANAFGDKAYRYIFAVPPAIHANDVFYTFYPTPGLITGIDPAIAKQHQQYLLNFVFNGNPSDSTTQFPTYKSQSQALELTGSGTMVITDPWKDDRCNWFAQALYVPA
jgi:carboxylesterase type B